MTNRSPKAPNEFGPPSSCIYQIVVVVSAFLMLVVVMIIVVGVGSVDGRFGVVVLIDVVDESVVFTLAEVQS